VTTARRSPSTEDSARATAGRLERCCVAFQIKTPHSSSGREHVFDRLRTGTHSGTEVEQQTKEKQQDAAVPRRCQACAHSFFTGLDNVCTRCERKVVTPHFKSAIFCLPDDGLWRHRATILDAIAQRQPKELQT